MTRAPGPGVALRPGTWWSSLRPQTPCPHSLSSWDAGSSLCTPRPPVLSLALRDVLSPRAL
ncbi:hypothetical protein P7K49_026961, partial [Saguinus oedipus]